MAQDFIQLNGPNGFQPGPARRPDGPLPQPHGHPQMYPQGHAGAPSAPPRRANPVDLRGGPAIQISDVSRDLFSESDMRSELTEYAVFRFEKMIDKDAFDDQGRPKHPSWDTAIRTEDRSISKSVAAEKIRHLNQTSKNVVDKKGSLPPPLKRQIDRALEDLISWDPDPTNFQWNLAQIDHQLKPIAFAYPSAGPSPQYMPTGGHRAPTTHRSSTKQKSHSHSRSRSKSSSRRHTKNVAYERVSLTAYFKRVPGPDVDVARMWKERKRDPEGMYRPNLGDSHSAAPQRPLMPGQFQGQSQGVREPDPRGPRGPMGPMPTPQSNMNMNQRGPQMQPGNIPPSNNMPPLGNMPPGSMPRPGNMAPSNMAPGNMEPGNMAPGNMARPGNMPPRPGGPPHQSGAPGGPHIPRGPVHGMKPSDSDSDSGSVSGASHRSWPRQPHGSQTPPSSVSDHQGRGHHPQIFRPGRPRDQHGPGGFPRRSPSPHRAPRPPGPPNPLSRGRSVASHIERVRDAAYRRGHEDGGDSVRRQFEGLRVDDSEDDYGRDDDDYDDLDHRRYGYRHIDSASRREAQEFKRRMQHGSILEDDPFERSLSPSSYGYTTDGRGRRRRY